ncbi:uncharacterized protein RBU57_012764 [Macrochelys suwanniensis]
MSRNSGRYAWRAWPSARTCRARWSGSSLTTQLRCSVSTGRRNPVLCCKALRLGDFCIAHDICLKAFHLLGARNTQADRLSRDFSQREWSLHLEVAHQLFRVWGTPQMDLFAALPPVLLRGGTGMGRYLRCLPPVQVRPVSLCLPSNPSDQKGPGENKDRQGKGPLSQATLVWDPHGPGDCSAVAIAVPPGPALPGPQPPPPPEPSSSPPHGVAAQWLGREERTCSEGVQRVLLESRRPSARHAYLGKWSQFSRWAAERGVSLVAALIQLILDYFLNLRAQGLMPSSVKVHLVAISAFHPPVQGHKVFSHAMTGRFLKGVDRHFPNARPPWSRSGT